MGLDRQIRLPLLLRLRRIRYHPRAARPSPARVVHPSGLGLNHLAGSRILPPPLYLRANQHGIRCHHSRMVHGLRLTSILWLAYGTRRTTHPGYFLGCGWSVFPSLQPQLNVMRQGRVGSPHTPRSIKLAKCVTARSPRARCGCSIAVICSGTPA